MDIVKVITTLVDFCKAGFDKGMKIWDSLDEDKKKLYIGCAITAVVAVVIVGIAYSLGTSHGKRLALEEEEF